MQSSRRARKFKTSEKVSLRPSGPATTTPNSNPQQMTIMKKPTVNENTKCMRSSNEALDLNSQSKSKHARMRSPSPDLFSQQSLPSIIHIPTTHVSPAVQTTLRTTAQSTQQAALSRLTVHKINKPLTLTVILIHELNIVPAAEPVLFQLEHELKSDIEAGASMTEVSDKLRQFCRNNSGPGFYDAHGRFGIIVEVWYNYMQKKTIEIRADFNQEKGPWRHTINTVLSILE